MPTVINNPQPAASNTNNGMGFFLGALALIIFAILFFVYIMPSLFSSMRSVQSPQVNVPEQIDVNVKQK
jgi:hypothetical protein